MTNRHISLTGAKTLRAVLYRGGDNVFLFLGYPTLKVVARDSLTEEAAGDTLTHVEVAVNDCEIDGHILSGAGCVLVYGGIVVAGVIGEDKRLLSGHYIVFLSFVLDCDAGLHLM
jgi:hypothetical protein